MQNAYKEFCDKKLEEIHGSLTDAQATLEILEAQVQSGDVPCDVKRLHHFCYPDAVDRTGRFIWRKGEVFFNFGKHNGKTLQNVAMNDPDYLQWMIGDDFPWDVKEIVQDALRCKFPTR